MAIFPALQVWLKIILLRHSEKGEENQVEKGRAGKRISVMDRAGDWQAPECSG